jgi:Helix-turn-helix.
MSTSNGVTLESIFSSRMRELQQGRSVSSFAKFCGLSQQAMDRYIKAQRMPPADAITQIARICDVSADWLLGLSDEKRLTPRGGLTATNGGVAVSGGVNGNGSVVAGNGNVVNPAISCEELLKRVAELEKTVKRLTRAKK